MLLECHAMRALRPLAYIWASPGTAVGLTFALLALATSGRAKVIEGVLEVHGGWVTILLRRGNRWMNGPISAMTLGHVVIGCDESALVRTRRHEHVHVKQYERWGPLFIPVYLLASVWVRWRGGDPYLDNPFEVQAYLIDDPNGRFRRPA